MTAEPLLGFNPPPLCYGDLAARAVEILQRQALSMFFDVFVHGFQITQEERVTSGVVVAEHFLNFIATLLFCASEMVSSNAHRDGTMHEHALPL